MAGLADPDSLEEKGNTMSDKFENQANSESSAAGEEAGRGKRRRREGEPNVMDTEAGFLPQEATAALPSTPATESDRSSSSDHGAVSDAQEPAKPPVAQSRKPMELDDIDEFGWDAEHDLELVSMMKEVQLDDSKMKRLANERVRIVQPIPGDEQNPGEQKWRSISPGQFENEKGRWPNKADYDANTVLIQDENGMRMTKPQHYESFRGACKTAEEFQNATKSFNDDMDALGMSRDTFAANHPAKGDEGRQKTPDGVRNSPRVSEHPIQSGRDLPNILITGKDGEQTLHFRSSAELRDATLSDLLTKHGRSNVELRRENGHFGTVDAIERARSTDPNRLAYKPDKLFESLGNSELASASVYVRTEDGAWISAEPGKPLPPPTTTDGHEVLLINPDTKALLNTRSVSKVLDNNREAFGKKTVGEMVADAGLHPKKITLPRPSPDVPPDVLIRIDEGKFVPAKSFKKLSVPLTEKFLKTDIYLPNYGTVIDSNGKAQRRLTGNYSTLAAREHEMQRKGLNRSPGEQYAALYSDTPESQRTQLKMPPPAPGYQREITPPVSGREQTPFPQFSSRESSQMPTNSAKPATEFNARDGLILSPERQMQRAPRSLGRG